MFPGLGPFHLALPTPVLRRVPIHFVPQALPDRAGSATVGEPGNFINAGYQRLLDQEDEVEIIGE